MRKRQQQYLAVVKQVKLFYSAPQRQLMNKDRKQKNATCSTASSALAYMAVVVAPCRVMSCRTAQRDVT